MDASATRRSPRSSATPTTSPTGSTCASDIQFDTRVSAGDLRRREPAAGRFDTDDGGERVDASFCVMATGCLSSRQHARLSGARARSRARRTTPAAGRTRASTSPASGRRHRHRVVGDPVDPDDRRAGGASSPCSSARRAITVPARNRPLDAAVKEIKASYAEFRARANRADAGCLGSRSGERAGAGGERGDERRREYEARWEQGGLAFLGAFTDLLLDRRRQRHRGRVRPREDPRGSCATPRSRRSSRPTHVFGCKRLCVDTGYYETFNQPNVTLVDVQRDADRGDHADGLQVARRASRARLPSCSPPASTP